MKPLITIRKSLWSISWTFVWTILLSILIIPVIYLICKILKVRSNYLEIYENRVVEHSGVLNKHKSEYALTKILGVSVNKTLFGSMLGYGDIHVDLVGENNIYFTRVKHIDEVEKFFKERIINPKSIKQTIMEK